MRRFRRRFRAKEISFGGDLIDAQAPRNFRKVAACCDRFRLHDATSQTIQVTLQGRHRPRRANQARRLPNQWMVGGTAKISADLLRLHRPPNRSVPIALHDRRPQIAAT